VKIKGLEYLLNAVSEIQDSNYVLVVAGTGSELNELSRLASSLGLQGRVRFLGYCPQDRIWLHLANAWVLVLPSVSTNWGKEPWGLVINEAFNQGVPVIATDAVGAAAGGLVRDGENGFVVPERNSSALAAALDRVLKNADLRAKLSANARETIAHWNQDRMADGFSAAIAYAGRSLAGGK
jgi:glycosyltransferase involved in cell wall biosynthesis